MKSEWDFVKYRDKVSFTLDDKEKKLISDSSSLIESHVKEIASYFNKNVAEVLQAIEDMDGKKITEFIPGISPIFANEILFTLKNYVDGKVTLGLTTGVMTKALQKGYENPTQNPIIQQGLTITSDNKIVLGIRAKPYNFKTNM